MAQSSETFRVRDLYSKLREDIWRKSNPFSEDVQDVHAVLFKPYARDHHREAALKSWLSRRQPCIFGRIAAAKDRLHYCILTDQDLQRSDQFISEKIKHELRAWKRRAAHPAPGLSQPAHGFILAVASELVAHSAADDRLKEFALAFLNLWECPMTQESQGAVFWETLYLADPRRQKCLRLKFTVDFFAVQGDGQWWNDHRIPGGIAFTANSAGHMKWHKEWYEAAADATPWLLRTAMKTIDLASDIGYGKATWLRALLPGGVPIDGNVASPLKAGEFPGLDWTKYGGHLHTDLAVRDEFFLGGPEVPPDVARRAFIQDFTYLIESNADHRLLIAGEPVEWSEVVDEIGDPSTYVEIEKPRIQTDGLTSNQEQEINLLLSRCQKWALSANEVREYES